MRRNLPFYLLMFGAFALLTISRNAQSGMFLDGVTYASIARNMAEGRGSFWSPFYTDTLYASFYEHPPLGFAIQAAAFALFGDHLAVERIYCLVVGGATALLMMAIWRRTIEDRQYDWLPLVFWLVPPAVSWSIVNNMLEVTQAAFTTLAVLACIRSLERSSTAWLWAIGSALAIVAAVLTKGPVGFFPLVAPLIVAVVTPRRAASALKTAATMFTTLATTALLLFVAEESRLSLTTYWNHQVVASIRGARGGVGRMSALTQHLAWPVMARMGSLAALAWLAARMGTAGQPRQDSGRRWTTFFFVLALAGSLPVALSARLAGHYFVPSIAIFSLAFASLSLPWVAAAFDRWRELPLVRTAVGGAGIVMLLLAFAIPLLGGSLEPRDVALMREYRALTPAMPRGTTVGTCEAARVDWGLHAYMQRFFEVSLDPDPAVRHGYYLQVMDRSCDAPRECQRTASTDRFTLYRCAD